MSMLVGDRIAAAYALASQIEQRGKVFTTRDLGAVQELIEAEEESLARATTIADNERYQAPYRASQRTAAENSREIIMMLEKAKEHIQANHAAQAAASLRSAASYRHDKKEKAGKNPSKSVSALYTQYKAETDEGFHAWLRAHRHTEALIALGVAPAQPEPRRKKRAPSKNSNRPEDY